MSKNNKTGPGNWHTSNTGNHQGLIIDDTGANIAVAYDKKHAPLIAAAPKLLASCKRMLDIIKGHAGLPLAAADAARAAIQQAEAI